MRVLGGDTECPLQICQLSRSSESTHFLIGHNTRLTQINTRLSKDLTTLIAQSLLAKRLEVALITDTSYMRATGCYIYMRIMRAYHYVNKADVGQCKM